MRTPWIPPGSSALSLSLLVACLLGCEAKPAADAASNSRCGSTPTLLVSASTYPVPAYDGAGSVSVSAGGLVANASDLYYVTSAVVANGNGFSPFLRGSVRRVPLGGGDSSEVASGYVFWMPVLTDTSVLLEENDPDTGATNAVSVSLANGTARTIASRGQDDSLDDLTTDGTYAYFADGAGVEAVPLDSSPGGSLITLSGETPNDIEVFGHRLLFLTAQGQVYGAPLPPNASNPVTLLGEAGTGPGNLMPCGSDACWLAEGTASIQRMSPTGGPLTTLPVPEAVKFPRQLAFDGTSFYLIGTDASDGVQHLGRMSSDGRDFSVLSTMSADGGGSVAVDDECIYWSNASGIFSVAKAATGPFTQ